MQPETFGPYQLLELIGRGGMGEVYRAHDTARGRTVAIKRLVAGLADDPGFAARFRRECSLAARLADPHIVPIHDFGSIEGRLFLDMRFVEGPDLGTLVRRDGPLPPQRAVTIVEQLAGALDAAHAAGLVHRDVKPSNALITNRHGGDFGYLVDFGIARSLDSAATSVTTTGTTLGTLDYMAPERFADAPLDGRVDVYALACVLHETLTGRKPFPVTQPVALMAAHLGQPPPRPSTIRPGVPSALDDVVARGMAKDPAQRYPTAGALAAAARAALADSVGGPVRPADPTVSAPRLPLLGPPTPEPPRRRRLTIVLGSAVLVVATGTLLVLAPWQTRGTPGPAPSTATPAAQATTSVAPLPPTTVAAQPVLVTAPQPSALVAAPDGTTAFSISEDRTTWVEIATGATPRTAPVGGHYGAITPDGTRLLVLAQSGELHVLDTASGAEVGTLSVGSSGGGMSVTADGRTAYVATLSTVAIVDLGSLTVAGRVDVGNAPYATAVGPGGVYVTWVELQNTGNGELLTVDPAARTVTSRIPVGVFATDLAVAGPHVLVGARNDLWVVDPAAKATATVPGVVPLAVAASANGSRGYAVVDGGLVVLDPATATVVRTVPVPGAQAAPTPGGPGALAVTSAGKALVGTASGITVEDVSGV